MAVELNHTIVSANDSEAAARFMADVLGLAPPTRFGPFWVVKTANGVSMDFMQTARDVAPQHYAFLLSEDEFDDVFARVRGRGLTYWADPGRSRAGAINHHDGGRGVYFEDPEGHLLEIITRPYGSGG